MMNTIMNELVESTQLQNGKLVKLSEKYPNRKPVEIRMFLGTSHIPERHAYPLQRDSKLLWAC